MILGHDTELIVLTTKFLACNCKKIGSELYKGNINFDKRTESLSYKQKHLQLVAIQNFPFSTQRTNKINCDLETTTIWSCIKKS